LPPLLMPGDSAESSWERHRETKTRVFEYSWLIDGKLVQGSR
jgi:hypothetical protein